MARDSARFQVGRHHIERRPGQRADRIEAEIAPQLEPDLGADIVEHRRLEAALLQQPRDCRHPLGGRAIRLAKREFVAIDMLDHPRLHDLGRRINHRADHPLGPDGPPLPVLRIDRDQAPLRERAGQVVEIPPRHPVLAGHHRSAPPEQRPHMIGCLPGLMGLEPDDHHILRAELGRIGARLDPRNALAAVNDELETVAHRLEMSTTGNDRQLDALDTGKTDREIAADRPAP